MEMEKELNPWLEKALPLGKGGLVWGKGLLPTLPRKYYLNGRLDFQGDPQFFNMRVQTSNQQFQSSPSRNQPGVFLGMQLLPLSIK